MAISCHPIWVFSQCTLWETRALAPDSLSPGKFLGGYEKAATAAAGEIEISALLVVSGNHPAERASAQPPLIDDINN